MGLEDSTRHAVIKKEERLPLDCEENQRSQMERRHMRRLREGRFLARFRGSLESMKS